MMDQKSFHSLFQDHFYDIINQATNGIAITDPKQHDNPVIYVNQAFSDIFEYTFEEVVGRNCRFLQNDDKAQTNLQLIREAIANKTSIQVVLRNYTKSGKLIYNEVRISPIFDKDSGEVKFFLGIQKDLTKRSFIDSKLWKNDLHLSKEQNKDIALQELQIFQTELLAQNEELIEKDRQLANLNNEFSSLFLDAPVSYLVVDTNLEIQRYNKLANKYFQFSKMLPTIKSLFMITNKKYIEQLISWVSNKKYEINSLEIEMISYEQDIIRFELQAKQYPLDESLLMISLNNIQESFEVKTMLEKKIEQELEKRVAQESYILKQAKLASMGQMIDSIAHQWLNPLSLLKLYAQESEYILESENITKEDYELVLDNQKKMDLQIHHLVDTLEEFRSFFRPDNSTNLESLKEIIDSALMLTNDELLLHKIDVAIDIKSNLHIKVVKNQFKHVFLNLILNSKDAFIENNIKNKKIRFELLEQNGVNTIKYYDNAGGIPNNIIDKIFKPNFTTKKLGKGTGVGLYLCKLILDKYHFDISVKNIDEGVCFTITYNN